ncbi:MULTISPECIES: extracellular solute-binding protein [unclassified Beijerinckia]|uniref:extracellular solute-binding protein n=1 Tax=unclassified Beijerinckia TaxID=2638183 RepID=UPI0008994B6E|nr:MULTISPECIES: extracellular solute-binding protein [unclassified Beijerinckia]MDH7794576.1 ABC-type Fe3+ transport system substrate-binding protein [Beijerinckia sp. GAS462]SEB67174.1 ABC-type Fe3+ transport system, substrate-binding protein [Beijerinckia sp. 28-YEA-48]
MMKSFRTAAGVIPAAALVVAMSAASAKADMTSDLYEKAKAEGALTLYTGGPVAPYQGIVAEFEQKFPGIKVSVTGGFSNVLNDKIEQQLKAGKLEADMALFQTAQDFVAWKKRNLLLNFQVEGHENIAPVFKDPDGAFTTARVNAIAYAYNKNAVAANEVPKSALDFLKPEFSDKIITCYPADDDATLYVFYTIVQKYGWSYMDRFMANKPSFIQGHLGVIRAIASGERLVTFDATTSTTGSLKQSGAPVELVIPQDDPIVTFTLTAGIFKDAPHPNAAKLFLNWYLQPEQQRRSGVFSARTDVPPPAGFKPLSAANAALDYNAFVSNEPLIIDLRKRFEAYTGPVVNKGGVQ